MLINTELALCYPERFAEYKREAQNVIKVIDRATRLIQLRKYLDWGRFEWSFMSKWATNVDEPFVKLMLGLAKHGYVYNCISMHKWWRRLKAVNQQHIVGYFTYQGFPAPGAECFKSTVWWDILYAHCCKTQAVFEKMYAVYKDDSFVELNLRALLGIDQSKDIKEAWVAWAKTNHPDKGGSVDKFVVVKAAYEEWSLCQPKIKP